VYVYFGGDAISHSSVPLRCTVSSFVFPSVPPLLDTDQRVFVI
jgi:hypothetical protein